jgi:hypothetical protein
VFGRRSPPQQTDTIPLHFTRVDWKKLCSIQDW